MKTINALIILLILFLNMNIKAQNSVDIFEKGSADTIYMAVNKSAGWQFINPFLTPVGEDSVMIEMILKPYRGVDWNKEHLIARITREDMIPSEDQMVFCNLITAILKVHIKPDGNCSVQLISGKLPEEDSLAIPVRAIYQLK